MKLLINFLKKNNFDYEENVSFKELTSYKTGGICSLLVHPKDSSQIIELLNILKQNSISYYLFGNGTNILASDETYDGVIIILDKLVNIIKNKNTIEVESGYSLSKLSLELTKEGYKDFESFVGIPGWVGGAVYMNAGAYGTSIENVLISVKAILNDEIVELEKEDLGFSYRKSIFQDNKDMIILSAKFRLESGNKEELLNLIEDRTKKRIASQPLDKPSAGSVFRNPTDDYAGRLIEECNLKGYKIGDALVSEKHANFIVNDGNATSEDVLKLMNYVKEEVKSKFGIDLRTEQILFNFK